MQLFVLQFPKQVLNFLFLELTIESFPDINGQHLQRGCVHGLDSPYFLPSEISFRLETRFFNVAAVLLTNCIGMSNPLHVSWTMFFNCLSRPWVLVKMTFLLSSPVLTFFSKVLGSSFTFSKIFSMSLFGYLEALKSSFSSSKRARKTSFLLIMRFKRIAWEYTIPLKTWLGWQLL